MDIFNSYCVIIGTGAVCAGIYMLITKKLIGRNTGSAKKETIMKFLPIEVVTYVVEGLLLVLIGLPQYFPFMEKDFAVYTAIGIALAVIAVNVVLGKKYFPDAKAPSSREQGPRLK